MSKLTGYKVGLLRRCMTAWVASNIYYSAAYHASAVDVYVAQLEAYSFDVNLGLLALDTGDVVSWNGVNSTVSNLIFETTAFLSIQDAIDMMDEGDTLYLAAGIYDEGAELSITKGLTIQGEGSDLTVLSGGSNNDQVLETGEHRVMKIDVAQANVSINDLAIVDGIAASEEIDGDSGGAIFMEGDDLDINRCDISGCFAADSGGAVYVEHDNGDVPGKCQIIDCTIDQNSSNDGGGIYVRSGGIEIENTTLSMNHALEIDGADGYGGALQLRGTEAVIRESEFLGNTSNYTAGAIYQFSSNIEITDSLFKGNSAESAGAIYSRDTITMSRVNFIENSASVGGGALINFTDEIIATDVRFYKNTAGEGDGGGMANRADFTGTNIQFVENIVINGDGGGFVHRTGLFEVNNLRVIDNQVLLSENPAFGVSVSGGGIANSTTGTMDITNVVLSGNISEGDGGGLYSNNSYAGSIIMKNATISDNYAAEEGGGIYANLKSFALTQCTISGNQAVDGAGIYDQSDEFSLTHCTIVENEASDEGGGVYHSGSAAVVTITNTIVAGNSAGSSSVTTDTRGDFVGVGVNFIGEENTSYDGFRDGIDLSFDSTSLTLLNSVVTSLSDNGGAMLTHALVLNSPAVDAGVTAAVPADLLNDQRGEGFTRIYGTTVDIGAMEFSDKGAEPNLIIKEALAGENVVLEAVLVPGRQYAIEYSDTLASFTRVPVTLTAETNIYQLDDAEPLFTPSPSSEAGRRFYRLVILP
ncbi:MAG: choice-of-anchor Q domain-containing protein [Bacteroidota bacterium]